LLAPQVASLLGAGLGMAPSIALEDLSAPEEEDYGDEEAQVRNMYTWVGCLDYCSTVDLSST